VSAQNNPKITLTLPLSTWHDITAKLARLPCNEVYEHISEFGRQIFQQIDAATFADLTAGITPVSDEPTPPFNSVN
jgi:hypothetical protein